MSSTRNAQGAKGAGIVAAAVLMTMSVGSASAATPPPAIDPTVNLDPAVSLNAAAAPVAALQPALWRDAPAIAQSAPVRASRAVALRPTRAVVQAKFTVFTTSSPATKDMRGVEASLYKGAYYNTSVESVRLCIVRRESEGHYDVVNPSGSYRGAYQVSPQLARGATWMMLKEHRALMGPPGVGPSALGRRPLALLATPATCFPPHLPVDATARRRDRDGRCEGRKGRCSDHPGRLARGVGRETQGWPGAETSAGALLRDRRLRHSVFAILTNFSAAGSGVEPCRTASRMVRGSSGGSSCLTTIPGSAWSTARSGITAGPMPARTIPCIAPLSFDRKT
jgi:hypothetical protein